MKNIAITGASSGIGKELALSFASSKVNLFINSRSKESLNLLAKDLKELGAKVSLKAFDVSCEEEALKWCDEIFKQRLDLLILNAGISSGLDESPEKQIQISKVNALGVANIIFHAVKRMQEQELIQGKRGQIVLIASIASFLALPNAPAYSASKHYVKALAEALSIAYPELCFSVICPGFIKTELTKHINIKNMMDVKKAAKKIVRAIEKEKNIYSFPFHTALGAKIYNLLPFCVKKRLKLLFTQRSRL